MFKLFKKRDSYEVCLSGFDALKYLKDNSINKGEAMDVTLSYTEYSIIYDYIYKVKFDFEYDSKSYKNYIILTLENEHSNAPCVTRYTPYKINGIFKMGDNIINMSFKDIGLISEHTDELSYVKLKFKVDALSISFKSNRPIEPQL